MSFSCAITSEHVRNAQASGAVGLLTSLIGDTAPWQWLWKSDGRYDWSVVGQFLVRSILGAPLLPRLHQSGLSIVCSSWEVLFEDADKIPASFYEREVRNDLLQLQLQVQPFQGSILSYTPLSVDASRAL